MVMAYLITSMAIPMAMAFLMLKKVRVIPTEMERQTLEIAMQMVMAFQTLKKAMVIEMAMAPQTILI